MASLGSASLLLLLCYFTCVFANETTTTTTTINPEEEGEQVGDEVIEGSGIEELRDQAVTTKPIMRRDQKPKIQKNKTISQSGFMPSVHLGPIMTDQQRQPTKVSPFNVGPLLFPDEYKNSPFNAVSAIKFGDGKDDPPSKLLNPQKLEKLQKSPIHPSETDGSFVKFTDDTKEYKEHSKENCSPAQKISSNHRQSEPIYHQHLSYLAEGSPVTHHQHAVGYSEESYDNANQQYANYETKPTKYDTVTPYIYSAPHHQAIAQSQAPQLESYHHQHHHHNEATVMKPEMIINLQHPMSFQAASYDSIQKPKTVIYVSHEPHQQYYHQPPSYNHLEVLPEHEETYPIYYDQPTYKSLSPWKKILRIIGAFLPLGLLFALLPNVIKPNANPDNPSIVLSKLRVNDLAPEHKRDRLALDTDGVDCREERSICRLLAAADLAGLDFLEGLVSRIAENTADSSVRKKELDRIFEAAKLGNCDILTCNFYDGTLSKKSLSE